MKKTKVKSKMENKALRHYTEMDQENFKAIGFGEGKPSIEQAQSALIPLRGKEAQLTAEIKEMTAYVLRKRADLAAVQSQIDSLERVITPVYKVKAKKTTKPKTKAKTRKKQFALSDEDQQLLRGFLDKDKKEAGESTPFDKKNS